MNKRQLANAYAAGYTGKCHNAQATSDGRYILHRSTIVERVNGCTWRFNWCGGYTATTASHMNEVLRALSVPMRVSYAEARETKAPSFCVAA